MMASNFTGDAGTQQQMIALAYEYAAEQFHLGDLPYRLSSWVQDDPANIGLWVGRDQQLDGWAVLNPPFWTIDIVCRPERESSLYPEMLGWADARAHTLANTPEGHPCWFVNPFARQLERIRHLEALGFASQADVGENSWSKVLLERPGSLPVAPYRVPDGFTIRPLRGMDEVEAYVSLHQAVFESKNMTVDWRARVLQHPLYHPDLDLVAVDRDGMLAAFCICWLAHLPGGETIGQIEPLGSSAKHRHLGLGRLVLAEGLRRLQTLGAQRMLVETDHERNTALRLYEAMGFAVREQILVYRKNYA